MNLPDNGPPGNGVEGGDFVYYFAVGDLGDSYLTAASASGNEAFWDNFTWTYQGMIGDNLSYQCRVLGNMDQDVIRINDVSAGDVISLSLSDTTGTAHWMDPNTFGVELYRLSIPPRPCMAGSG